MATIVAFRNTLIFDSRPNHPAGYRLIFHNFFVLTDPATTLLVRCLANQPRHCLVPSWQRAWGNACLIIAEFNPETSDFDFLVELDATSPGSRARRWTELADELEHLLGRHVDLVNPGYIRNPYFLRAVNESRTLIYDRQNTQTAD